ncbi:MAG: lycopene cyclase domain-containing protein, partial [Bacteroidota bacterium]
MKSTPDELNHIVYLVLLIITLAYPFIKSFEHRIRMYRKWKYIFPAIIITALLFIAWDYWFVRQSVWHFNDHYILGFKILQLPVEEWIFFIIIPYACFFIYEVVRYFFRLKRYSELFFGLHFLLIIAFLFLGFWYQKKLYTFICFISAASLMIIMGFIQFIKKRLPYFYV